MVTFHPFCFSPFMDLPHPHHILQREYSLPQVYWTKSIMITMYVFVSRYLAAIVSIGKAASRRHRAEGRRKAEAGHPPR